MINYDAQDFLTKCADNITSYKAKIDKRKADSFLFKSTLSHLKNLYCLDSKEAEENIDYFVQGDQG